MKHEAVARPSWGSQAGAVSLTCVLAFRHTAVIIGKLSKYFGCFGACQFSVRLT